MTSADASSLQSARHPLCQPRKKFIHHLHRRTQSMSEFKYADWESQTHTERTGCPQRVLAESCEDALAQNTPNILKMNLKHRLNNAYPSLSTECVDMQVNEFQMESELPAGFSFKPRTVMHPLLAKNVVERIASSHRPSKLGYLRGGIPETARVGLAANL